MAVPSRSWSCSSFALQQLEKHGWKRGHGLGKTETGINEAIKVKMKQDTAGIGHDPGEEFTYHWWDDVFNKAASNIIVENNKDGVKLSSKSGVQMTISNKRTPKGKTRKPLLYGNFVKSATLTPEGLHQDDGGASLSSSSSEEEDTGSNHANIDAKFFKACGGRTAHKGARHGLNLSGKLKRIQEQDDCQQLQLRRNSNRNLKQGEVVKDEDDSKDRNRRKKHKKNKKLVLHQELSVKNHESKLSRIDVLSTSCTNETNGVGQEDGEKPRRKSKAPGMLETTDLSNCDPEAAECDRREVFNGLDKNCKRKKRKKGRNEDECAIDDVAEECTKNKIDVAEDGNTESLEYSVELCGAEETSAHRTDTKTKNSKTKTKTKNTSKIMF